MKKENVIKILQKDVCANIVETNKPANYFLDDVYKSVSQFITKHNVKRGKVLRKGRSIGVVDRHSLMMVVDRLNYTGPINENDVVWAS